MPHNITKKTTVEGDARKVAEVATRQYIYDAKGYPLTAVEHVEFPEDPQEPGTLQKQIYACRPC